MDRRERAPDKTEMLLSAMQSYMSGVWTAMPGIVASDLVPGKRTVTVQPAIRGQVQKRDGSFELVALPVLLDCPVVYPSGGGGTLTFPIKAGDECLVVFASRCIDGWWQLGDVQNQADMRKHDLSDGFALVGVSSVPKVIPDISTTTVQLRNDDGDAFFELNPTTKDLRLKTPAKVTIDAGNDVLIKSATKVTTEAPAVVIDAAATFLAKAPAISYFGNMTWTGYSGGAGTVNMSNMTFNWTNINLIATGGSLSHDARNIGSTHTHSGVQTGAGNTGIPN